MRTTFTPERTRWRWVPARAPARSRLSLSGLCARLRSRPPNRDPAHTQPIPLVGYLVPIHLSPRRLAGTVGATETADRRWIGVGAVR
jgi:hypothetical protein